MNKQSRDNILLRHHLIPWVHKRYKNLLTKSQWRYAIVRDSKSFTTLVHLASIFWIIFWLGDIYTFNGRQAITIFYHCRNTMVSWCKKFHSSSPKVIVCSKYDVLAMESSLTVSCYILSKWLNLYMWEIFLWYKLLDQYDAQEGKNCVIDHSKIYL